MSSFYYIGAGFVGFFFVLFIVWRYASFGLSIPCPAWLGWLVELDNPVFRNNSARSIIENLSLESGMKILDFGCGPGRLTIPVAKEVGPTGEVTAFDIQSGMLSRVHAKSQAENLNNINFIQGNIGEGKLGLNRYDRVLLVTVLGEIPNKKAAMMEIFDSLKPGGTLSVTEIIADPHFQRRSSVTSVAGSVGFKENLFIGHRLSYTIHFEKPKR